MTKRAMAMVARAMTPAAMRGDAIFSLREPAAMRGDATFSLRD